MRPLAAALIGLALLLAACGSDEVRLVPGDAESGRVLYEAECAECHGSVGEGSDEGPPLDDALYRAPGFTDQQVAQAVREGAREEHWDFGAMPGLRSLDDREISDIVAFVRLLQGP